MKIEDILARLLHEVAVLIANGQLTERKLARIIGISQPHIHHILNGKRRITPQVADLILEALGMDARQLMDDRPVRILRGASHFPDELSVRIPLLQGLVGPEDAAPDIEEIALYFPFPLSLLENPKDCIAVRTGRDDLLRGAVHEGDVAVLALIPQHADTARQQCVYSFRGSWVLDIPAPDLPERRTAQAELHARRRLLMEDATPIARVLWLLRGMDQFGPGFWESEG